MSADGWLETQLREHFDLSAEQVHELMKHEHDRDWAIESMINSREQKLRIEHLKELVKLMCAKSP
jgi:hypothetical protein